MKGKLSLLTLLAFLFTLILPSMVSSEELQPVVIDFYYEDDFYYYYSTFNGCNVAWDNHAVHMISTQDPEMGENGDPFVVFRLDYMFSCDDYPWMRIKLKNESVAPVFEMHFSTSTTGIVAATCTHVDISTEDEEFKEYIFNVPERNIASMHINELDHEETFWTGEIYELRLDGMWVAEPSGQVPYGSEMYIEYVAFFPTEEAANSFDIETYRAARTPKPTATPKPSPTATPEKTQTQNTEAPKQTGTKKDETGGGSNSTVIVLSVVGGIVVVAFVAGIIIIRKKKT
ncbi:MAG: hypothetical protein GX166_00975 [Clostridiaceae bacterium]|nr:hypothetical protein [Clostridiaceae bacterium]